MSQPYFEYSKFDETERLTMKDEIRIWLKDRILEYHNVPARTCLLIDILFVMLCYHLEYLNEHLHTECRFRASALFRDIPQEIINCAVITYPWNATEFTPKITGVPPRVLLMLKMENIFM